MNPFIKQYLEPKIAKFYDKHYTIACYRLLNDTDFFYLGDANNKVCRFCGRSESDGAKFESIAHCFPESIDNHYLASYYECDKCNSFFGKTIETEYAKFMGFYHTNSGIHGKKGIPTRTGTDSKSKAVWSNDTFILSDADTTHENSSVADKPHGDHVSIKGKQITYEDTAPSHFPIAVFKCFVKMALSVLPENDLSTFSDTISWLKEKRHTNIFSRKKLLCRYEMIPGYNTTKYPCYIIYKRKGTSQLAIYPQYLFNITYGNFSYLIEIPQIGELHQSIESVPFPHIPFFTSCKGTFDLSSSEKCDNFKQRMCFTADRVIEIDPDSIPNDLKNKALIKK